MLSCRDVSHTIACDELEESTLGRRLKIRLHLLMCRHCWRYAAQIRAIGRAARELFGAAPEEQVVVDRLRAALLEGREDAGRG